MKRERNAKGQYAHRPDRVFERARIGDGCWEWVGPPGNNGYGQAWLDSKNVSAHRAAYTLAFGEPKRHVLHRCNNRMCIRPSHLYDGSPQDNADDKTRAGGQPNRKLTFEQAEWVRANNGKIRWVDMAEALGVSLGPIQAIVEGRTYKYPTGKGE